MPVSETLVLLHKGQRPGGLIGGVVCCRVEADRLAERDQTAELSKKVGIAQTVLAQRLNVKARRAISYGCRSPRLSVLCFRFLSQTPNLERRRRAFYSIGSVPGGFADLVSGVCASSKALKYSPGSRPAADREGR